MPEAIATIFLGLVGLWVGNNYRRQIRTALTPQSAKAYARLWDITGISNPINRRPLQESEREELANHIIAWYFNSGGGMYLPHRSRILLFIIVENLVGPVDKFVPECARKRIELADPRLADAIRGCICKRQVSLLRTQLKNDMALYFKTATFNYLRADERDLLYSCKIRPSLTSRPMSLLTRPTRETHSPCFCGICPA